MNSSIVNILKDFDLTENQIFRFESLENQYKEWNQKINVISRKDIDHFFTRHLLHSLSIAMVIRFKPGTTILDAGTGGGFPGVPLAILFPDSHFTLVDSTGKKIHVINEICKSLDIENISTINVRFETIRDKFEFITGRAVTDLVSFYKTLKINLLSHGKNQMKPGVFYLTGGEIEQSLTLTLCQSKIWKLNDFFTDPWFESKKLVYLFH